MSLLYGFTFVFFGVFRQTPSELWLAFGQPGNGMWPCPVRPFRLCVTAESIPGKAPYARGPLDTQSAGSRDARPDRPVTAVSRAEHCSEFQVP